MEVVLFGICSLLSANGADVLVVGQCDLISWLQDTAAAATWSHERHRGEFTDSLSTALG